MTLREKSAEHEGVIQLRKEVELVFNRLDGTRKENYLLIDAACLVLIRCNTVIKYYHELMKGMT